MTFKAYLRQANQLAKENPELLYMEVVQASDNMGNTFSSVEFGASAGLFNEDTKEFILKGEFNLMSLPEDTKVNAVCIN